MNEVTPIHLAVATDQAFAMPVGAMLSSLAARLDPSRKLVIHALGDRLPEETWLRLAGSLPSERAEWHRFQLDSRDLVRRGFHTRRHGHIPPVTYFRLLLPELLPDHIGKVLYLDGDLLVRQDVAPLWDTEIGTIDLAAVPDRDLAGRLVRVRGNLPHHRAFDLDPDQPLFNMGVMLINLARWRAREISARAFGMLRCLGAETRWYDQDVLNVICHGYFRELSPRWNARPNDPSGPGSAGIVHFLTANKPWHWNYGGPYREEFFAAMDQTPWAGWRPARSRLAGPKLMLARVPRAWSKVAAAARRGSRRLGHALAYKSGVSAQRLRSTTTMEIPTGPREVRLFLAFQTPSPALAAMLTHYAAAGVERAFLIDLGGDSSGHELPASPIPAHWFRSGPGRSGIAVRRLLDRYGTGHWCVAGDVGHLLRERDGTPPEFRGLVAGLEQEGADLILAVAGRGRECELVGRDLRTRRLFRSTAFARFQAQAWDPPIIVSRPALFRYHPDLRLDADLALAGNVRRSARLLLRVPVGPPADP